MSSGSFLRYWMTREPIIVWSCIIGGIGVALPLVVPPIRSAMGYDRTTGLIPPPNARAIIEQARQS